MTSTTWGAVPASVRGLIDVLEEQIAQHSARLSSIDWPAAPGDISPALLETLREAEAVFAAAKDLRSVLTAYAHQVHQPRPVMADVARAQGASPQAVATRYTIKTVEAVEALIAAEAAIASPKPNAAQVRTAISHAASELERALLTTVPLDAAGLVERGRANQRPVDVVDDRRLVIEAPEL